MHAQAIIERLADDRAYRNGSMNQDRPILVDPEFQKYHHRIVSGSKVLGAVEFIRREARMVNLRTHAERVQDLRTQAENVGALARGKAVEAWRSVTGTISAIRFELQEARTWLTGKLPELRHTPPSVGHTVSLWRERGRAEIEAEVKLCEVSAFELRAQIDRKPAHLVAIALADEQKAHAVIKGEMDEVRAHWTKQQEGAADVLRAAEPLEAALKAKIEREAEHDRRAQAAPQRGGPSGPQM